MNCTINLNLLPSSYQQAMIMPYLREADPCKVLPEPLPPLFGLGVWQERDIHGRGLDAGTGGHEDLPAISPKTSFFLTLFSVFSTVS